MVRLHAKSRHIAVDVAFVVSPLKIILSHQFGNAALYDSQITVLGPSETNSYMNPDPVNFVALQFSAKSSLRPA